jgi:hypothetical protein
MRQMLDFASEIRELAGNGARDMLTYNRVL